MRMTSVRAAGLGSWVVLATAARAATEGASEPQPVSTPAPEASNFVLEAQDVVVTVPPAVREDIGELIVLQKDNTPLACEGDVCELTAPSQRTDTDTIEGLIASVDGPADGTITLYAFECTNKTCEVEDEAFAAVDSESFAFATDEATASKVRVAVPGGTRVRALEAPELIRGARLRLFFDAVIREKTACMGQAIPNVVTRPQEWGEDVPNSLVVTYRQPLGLGFSHEMRVDVFFLMANEMEELEAKLAAEKFTLRVEKLFASHRVHNATGARLRGFSFDASKDFRDFKSKIDSCL
jgi:hypothetical protein